MERFKKHLKCVGIWLGLTLGFGIGALLLVLYVALLGAIGNILDGYTGNPIGSILVTMLGIVGPITALITTEMCTRDR